MAYCIMVVAFEGGARYLELGVALRVAFYVAAMAGVVVDVARGVQAEKRRAQRDARAAGVLSVLAAQSGHLLAIRNALVEVIARQAGRP